MSIFTREKYAPLLRQIKEEYNINIGTSTWTYEDWWQQVYFKNYKNGKKTSTSKDYPPLTEFAESFPTACFDGAYYGIRNLQKYYEESPSDFVMALKATDLVTIHRFPKVPQWKEKGGQLNSTFLDAPTFIDYTLKPAVEGLKEKLGPIILQFSPINFGSWAAPNYSPLDFVKQLHKFLEQVPKGEVKLAVEVRDSILIDPEWKRLFDCLEYHGVAYVFNEQSNMPALEEQIGLSGIYTTDFTVVRALVRPGVSHNAAVEEFKPYTQTQLVLPGMREAMVHIIRHTIENRRSLYMYVNNRTEGNAPNTIAAVLDLCEQLKLFDMKS